MLIHHRKWLVGGAALLTLALLAACGGGGPPPAENTAPPAAEPTRPPAPKPTQRPGQANRDLQSRISESGNLTLLMDKKVLASYHIEISGTEPRLNQQTKQVETNTYSVKADLAGNNIYMLYTSAVGKQKAQTTEGYSINGGLAKSSQGGKEYTVEAGKLKESLGAVSLTWAFLPLDIVIPLAVAATGPTPQGEEAIDGRGAEKYGVDTANAPPGVAGAMGTLLTITSARGTVWVDKETGALLKLALDYQQDFVDPPGSKTVVGKGSGHIELLVTKVGKTTVQLPK